MAATSSPTSSRDWPTQATDTVESVVLTVKEKTTVPLQTAARAIVYGLVMAVVGIVALVCLIIGIIRIADVYLLGWAGRVNGHHRLYIAYLVLGMFFTLAGFGLWSRRTSKERT